MPHTQFKLIQAGPGALTRRVTFAEQPTWLSLASRIESLFGIQMQDVGVSYIDSDGDEITLSTQEELQEYYSTMSPIYNSTIKFTVKNIAAIRAQREPPNQPSPNIFDEDDWQRLNMSNFPGFSIFEHGKPTSRPKSPSSAFVETIESTATPEPPVAPDAYGGTVSPPVILHVDDEQNVPEQMPPTFDDSEDTDDASSVSVLANDLPDKQPIHVYEYHSRIGSHAALMKRRSRSQSPASHRSRASSRSSLSFRMTPIQNGGRPISLPISDFVDPEVSSVSNPPRGASVSRSRSVSPSRMPVCGTRNISRSPRITRPMGIPEIRSPVAMVPDSDPPTPVLQPLPPDSRPTDTAPSASPSLTHDVAGLLNSLTEAFRAHPELSEGLKNIVRNASQGIYWTSERDAMVTGARRAAESAQDGFVRATEHAQEEAGRRVTEALSGVFRALGNVINSYSSTLPNVQADLQPTDAPTTADNRESRGRSPSSRRTAGVQATVESSANAFQPPPLSDLENGHPIVPPPPHRPYRPPFSRPPRPPPGFAFHERAPVPRPLPFAERRHLRPLHPPHHPLPPLPPHPPHPPHRFPRLETPPFGNLYYDTFPPPGMYPPWAGPPPPGGYQGLRRSNTLPDRFGGPTIPEPPLGPDGDTPRIPPGASDEPISSSDRRAQLEEAKLYYKTKKEEWRRDREERRKEKERRNLQRIERRANMKDQNAPPRQELVTASDGEEALPSPFPPLPTMVDRPLPLPKGDAGRDHPVQQKSNRVTLRQELMKRLEGMGFTPRTHPQLELLVSKHVRAQPPYGKVNQETIIANLLEDLFVTPVPEASSSGTRGTRQGRREGVFIPGAWNA